MLRVYPDDGEIGTGQDIVQRDQLTGLGAAEFPRYELLALKSAPQLQLLAMKHRLPVGINESNTQSCHDRLVTITDGRQVDQPDVNVVTLKPSACEFRPVFD